MFFTRVLISNVNLMTFRKMLHIVSLIFIVFILSCMQQDMELGADWVSEVQSLYPPRLC